MSEILFSVTKDDCDWTYTRGTGKGGQKRNKTSSHVRCVHRASGAVGQSDDTRSQHQNKVIAFRRMAETKEFLKWHKIETARCSGVLRQCEEAADAAMKTWFLKVEIFKNGEWQTETA